MVKRIGRRRGSPDTREAILEVARRLFSDKGFDATTVRAIASDAGVDPAMIHHYFGTKEQLFLEMLQLPIDPREFLPQVLAGDKHEIGVRLVGTFLRVWDSPAGTAAAALLRSAMTNDWTVRLLREFLVTQVLRRVLAHIEPDPAEAPLRVSLVASQIAGMAMMRYIIKLEPLASAPPDTVIRAVAPTIQRYLTGDISGSAPATT